MTYQIATEQFSGPLDLLFNLIEKDQLDISRISLAKVTDEFLKYLDQFEEERPPAEIADFLYLASKLIYIKSTILLPYINPEDEEEISDLEKELRLYKEFQETTKIIRKILAKKNFLFSREKFFLSGSFFMPPKNVNVKKIFEAFNLVVKDFEKELMIVQKIRKKAISLAEKIEEIKNILQQVEKLNLSSFIKEKKTKAEIVVIFLAVLELVKRGIADLKQEKIFGEINVTTAKKVETI